MQTIYKRFSVILGFCLLLVILLANAIVTRRQLAVQVGNQSWVRHTQEVRLSLSQTESLIKDAETGQRGFLYTGNPTYLAPFKAALSQIDPQIDNLAQLTADNPSQQARVLHAPFSYPQKDRRTQSNSRPVHVGQARRG